MKFLIELIEKKSEIYGTDLKKEKDVSGYIKEMQDFKNHSDKIKELKEKMKQDLYENNALGFYTKEGGAVNLDSRGAIRIKKAKK